VGSAAAVEGFRRAAGDQVADIARRSYGGEEVSKQQWAQVFAAFGPRVPDAEQMVRRRQNLAVNSRGMDLVRRLDILDQLDHVDSPTLVSVGELNPVTPVASAEEIVDSLPKGIAELAIVAGAGHFAWLDAPDRYWPMIIEFIDGLVG
jgi:pimeloyl-ACP methyl ester carboxylesterase